MMRKKEENRGGEVTPTRRSKYVFDDRAGCGESACRQPSPKGIEKRFRRTFRIAEAIP